MTIQGIVGNSADSMKLKSPNFQVKKPSRQILAIIEKFKQHIKGTNSNSVTAYRDITNGDTAFEVKWDSAGPAVMYRYDSSNDRFELGIRSNPDPNNADNYLSALSNIKYNKMSNYDLATARKTTHKLRNVIETWSVRL